jgi:hypothetical protein
MTNISPRKQCLKGLRELLETGVRGNARTYIKMALDDLEGKGAKELTTLEYERLEDGKTLLDPKRSGLLMRAGGTPIRHVPRYVRITSAGCVVAVKATKE